MFSFGGAGRTNWTCTSTYTDPHIILTLTGRTSTSGKKCRTRIDPAQLDGAERRVLAQGFTITSLADEDSETNRRKLWELFVMTHRDVPWGAAVPDMPYEKFARRFDAPYLRDCTVVVRDGNRYVGFTQPMQEMPGVAGTSMTGVLAEYRNRGVGLAAKARCATLLRERGFTSMRTMNHMGNVAMLGVNARLGYISRAGLFFFKKLLASTIHSDETCHLGEE